MSLFDQIHVNAATGAIAYPKLPGFELDEGAVYRSAARFLPHCAGDIAMAVRHAIHQQLAAHQGAAQLLALAGAA